MARGLGAEFTRNFNHQTTHLITECAGSEKHRAALRTGRAIVRISWIKECYNLEAKADVAAHPIKPLAGTAFLLIPYLL